MIQILAVDDDPIILELIKRSLEAGGDISVDTSESAKEAFEQLKSTRYDAVLSDYMMPKMNGIEFLKKVRIHYPNMVFILFTGIGKEEVAIEALTNHADLYIRKSGTTKMSEVSDQIQKTIGLKRAEIALKESNARFRAIVCAAFDAILVVDEGGNVTLCNRSAEEMFGFHSDDIIGRIFYDIFAPEKYRPTYITALDYFRKSGQCPVGRNIFRATLLRRNGREFPVEISISPTTVNGKGELVAIFREVCEQSPVDAEDGAGGSVQGNLKDSTGGNTGSSTGTPPNPGGFGHPKEKPLRKSQKLTDTTVRWIVDRKMAGKSSADIADIVGVSKRRVEQIWKHYRDTGDVPVIGRKPGRPRLYHDLSEHDIVNELYSEYGMEPELMEPLIEAKYGRQIPCDRIQTLIRRMKVRANSERK